MSRRVFVLESRRPGGDWWPDTALLQEWAVNAERDREQRRAERNASRIEWRVVPYVPAEGESDGE